MISNKEEFLRICDRGENLTNPHLQSLALIRRRDWNAAHHLIQDYGDKMASRIHGYLHRMEGDNWNAKYWYRRGGVSFQEISFEEEWEIIVDDYFNKL